jgi:hypothetical protein
MSGDSTKITCGTVGNPCKKLEDYPVCHPKDEEAGWVGLEEVIVCEYEVDTTEDGTKEVVKDFRLLVPGEKAPDNCKTSRPPNFEDDEETRYTNENELAQLLEVKPDSKSDDNFLTKMGLKGVCKSPYLGEGKPTSWYAYVDNAGHAGYLTLYNKGAPTLYHDQNGIWLSYDEMMGLAGCEDLNLQKYDVICSSPPELKRKEGEEGVPDRSYSPGRYHFKKDQHFLEHMLEVLKDENVKIEGFEKEKEGDVDRRKLLIKHLEKIYDKETAQLQFLENTSWVQWISAGSALLVSAYFGHMLFKMIKDRLTGRVVTTDYDKIVDKRLKDNSEYDIKGRDLEARTAWRMASKKSGYVNIMIDAPTGEGKDVIVEKMIIMKEKGDPVVPEQFRKARVMKINAAEFQSGTQYRGNVADKVAEIARAARKGPVIFYMSEIDLVFLSGGTMSGDTESPGKLILDLVDDPAIKRNLLIIGTTSRGKKMLERYPDLQRRFNWPEVRLFSLETMIDVMDGPATAQLAREYDVKISPEAVEAAARMGEAYYRPAQQGKTGAVPPRFAAVTAVLETAVQIASEEKSLDLKLDHIIRATDELCAISIFKEDSAFKEILEMPVRDLEAKVASELKAGQVDPLMAQLESARLAMGGEASQASEPNPIVREMMKHPEYEDLSVYEMKERAEAINVLMEELRVAGELGRFYDKDAKRFLDGKFELLAKAAERPGVETMARLTKAAEAVEKAKTPDAAKHEVEKFAKEMAKKK